MRKIILVASLIVTGMLLIGFIAIIFIHHTGIPGLTAFLGICACGVIGAKLLNAVGYLPR